MAANAIPRTIVKLGLSGVRMPLSIAERIGDWSGLDLAGLPQVAVYDSVEGQAKQVLGRLIHDDELVSEGQLQQRAARHRGGAQWLSTEADAVRAGAESSFERRVESAEARREQVEEEAQERLEDIRAREEQARQEAEERARKREEAARKAARTRAKAAEAKKRQAELARIQAEADALEKQSRAVEAEKLVTAIDEDLEAKRAARRNDDPA